MPQPKARMVKAYAVIKDEIDGICIQGAENGAFVLEIYERKEHVKDVGFGRLVPVTIHLPAPRRPARKATKKK